MATAGFDNSFGPRWWSGFGTGNMVIDNGIRKNFASVPIYRCPSRRGGGPLFNEPNFSVADDTWNRANRGPQGDYAFVLSFQISSEALAEYVTDTPAIQHYYKTTLPLRSIACQEGPFLLAELTIITNSREWLPRCSMARWSDGSSNQLIVGEKHIPDQLIDVCDGTDSTPSYTLHDKRGDCSFLNGGDPWLPSVARIVRVNTTYGNSSSANLTSGAVALYRPTQNSNTSYNNGAFGSAHPGISHFVFGDGAVRPFPVTTPTLILAGLGTVADGNTIAIPQL